jgi:hypothetical protein
MGMKIKFRIGVRMRSFLALALFAGVAALFCLPIVQILWVNTHRFGHTRTRIEVGIRNEIAHFVTRLGSNASVSPNQLFNKMHRDFEARISEFGFANESLEPPEVLVLYTFGVVTQRQGSLSVEPLFNDLLIDKPVPGELFNMVARYLVDDDNDGWFEIVVPGSDSMVYVVQSNPPPSGLSVEIAERTKGKILGTAEDKKA